MCKKSKIRGWIAAFALCSLLFAGGTASAKEAVTLPGASEIAYEVTLTNPTDKQINAELEAAVGRSGYTKINLRGQIQIAKQLIVYSNTIIDATGAKITKLHNGSNIGNSIMRNGPVGTNIGGYNLTKNVWLIGGEWDGGDLSEVKGKENGGNSFSFVHASGIRILNADFHNNYNAHLLELNASSDVLVQGCSFNGVLTDNAESASKTPALQLDIAKNSTADHDSVPDGYVEDGTACSNIRIIGNSFNNKNTGYSYYGMCVGSNKTLVSKGIYHKNITFAENSIAHTQEAAINVKGYDGFEVSNNTVSDAKEMGIYVRESKNGSVHGNTITDAKNMGIVVAEKSSGVSVDENTISGAGNTAIAVNKESAAKQITKNTITNPASPNAGAGIFINLGAKVTGAIASNTVTGSKNNGIWVNEKASVEEITGNTVSGSAGYGLFVTKNSSVGKVSKNEFRSSGKSGISLNGCSVTSVEGNTLSANKLYGIHVLNSAKISVFGDNTVTQNKSYGVYVGTNGKIQSYLSNTVSKNGDDTLRAVGGGTIAAPQKGVVVTVGSLKVKVTKSTQKAKTVQVIGVTNKKLTAYSVPEKLMIGTNQFQVTGIAAKAFSGCKKAKTITLPKTITSVGKKAFANTAASLKVTVPKAQYAKISKLLKKSGLKAKNIK